MRRLKKRILAILLAVAMTVCETPVTFAATAADGVSEAQSAYLQAKEEALQSEESSEAGEVTDEEAGEETLPAESASEELGGVNPSEESGEQAGETEQSAASSHEESAQEETGEETVSESGAQESEDAVIEEGEAPESEDAATEESGEQAGETEQAAASSHEESAQEETGEEAVSESEAQEAGEAVTEESEAQEAAETVVMETEEETAVSYLGMNTEDNAEITANTTLSENMVYTGNLIVTASLDLNGYTLEVRGNLYQRSGILTVGNGKLEIGGSYILQGVESNGEPKGTNGRLYMKAADGTMNVRGNFVFQTTTYDSELTAGTLRIGGNIQQIGNAGNATTFKASGTHKTILDGSGAQTVEIAHKNTKFNGLEINGEDRAITWKGYLNAASMESDMKVTAGDGFDISGMGLNGKTMTVTGEAGMSGNATLAGGNLKITGSLRQTAGIMTVDSGMLEIGGSYILQGVESNGEPKATNGKLIMSGADGTMNVRGDFVFRTNTYDSELTAGTLRIGGNIQQIGNAGNATTFKASGTHKTILDGSGAQTVEIAHKNTKFNGLEINGEDRAIIWKGYLNAASMESDMKVTAGDGFDISGMGLNGKTMTVTGEAGMSGNATLAGGNLKITGSLRQTAGIMTVDSGMLEIGGSYILQGVESNGEPKGTNGRLEMKAADGTMNVRGDFVFRTNTYDSELTAGTLRIGGNIQQIGNASNATTFKASKTHRTILDGSGEQTVEIADTDTKFNELEINGEDRVIIWKGYLNAASMGSNMKVTAGDGFNIRGLGLNGKTMDVTGDAGMSGSTSLAGGTLSISGSLRQTTGTMTVDSGTLEIGGSYYMQGADGSYSTGKLVMNGADGTANVRGNLVFQTTTYTSELTAGTLHIGGNITQIENASNATTFKASGTHKTILDGSGEQTVEIADTDTKFNELEITKDANEELRTITWKGYLNAASMGSDMKVTAGDGFNIRGLGLNGKTVDVTGDAGMSGSATLAGGTLSISGSLRQTAGTMTVDSGTLEIGGSYYMQGVDSSYSTGKLVMNGADGTANVRGNLVFQTTTYTSDLTAGTLRIGGNITQIENTSNATTFKASGTHKTILDGSGAQTIEIETSSTAFNELEVTKDSNEELRAITWNGYLNVNTLADDILVSVPATHILTVNKLGLNGHNATFQGDVLLNTDIALNGKTLDVSGNLRQISGKMDITGGTLKVGGWYKIQKDNSGTPAASTGTLLMTKENDLVEVGGDFVIHTGNTNKFTAGELRVGGNFSQAGTGSSCFAAGGTHKTVMTGQSGPYTISMAASKSKFAYLKLTLPYDQYIFQPDEERWDVLMVTSIALNKENLTFYSAEGTEQLTAVIDPEKATNKEVTWESSNTAVATVDQTGLVTAAGKGTAVITVSAKEDETVKASCVVTVTDEDALIREQLIRNPRTKTEEINGVATEVTTWDRISFGSYLQEDTNEDEEINADDEKKPILWRVLAKDESREELLLIADQCLDLQKYHSQKTGAALTWEASDLKTWLNSEFKMEAFDAQEQEALTEDGIFLLTQEEIEKAEYGFVSDRTREALLSDYAEWLKEDENSEPGWWLATPGTADDQAYCAEASGTKGVEDADSLLGVRPVIRIPISSLLYGYEGWVDSEGTFGKDHVLTKHEKKEATCGEAGTKEYWSCVICGECFEDENAEDEISDLETWKVLPATGQHSLTQQKGTAPGCTAPGKKTYHSCGVCGKHFEDEDGKSEITQEIESWSTIPASGHAMTLHEAALADCTKTGKKAYYSCGACGKNFEDADGKKQITEAVGKWEIVPAKGHSMKAHAGSAATCTAAGAKTYYTCSACGKNFEDAGGKSEITGDVQKWAVIPAGGHSLKAHAGSAATCAKAGAKAYYTCSACGKNFEDAGGKAEITGDVQKWAAIPLTGHSLTKHEGTEASCAEGGTKTYYTCSVCGKHFEDADAKSEITGDVSAWAAILPGAHTLEFTEGTPASCTEEGTKPYYSCAVCGKYFEDADAKTEITQEISDWEVLPMTEHVEVANESVTPATTTKDGLAGGTVCAVCGEELQEQETVYKASNIKLSAASYGYDGKVKKPVLTVKDCEGNAIPKEYYSVKTPSGRKNVGTYTYKITFKGWYKGTASVSFDIVPAAVKLKSVTAGSKRLKVEWAKNTKEITGYEIQYSTSKKFTASTTKTVTIASKTATGRTITKLSAKKKYYVRIRAYKTVSKKKYYSKWSASKSATTKKEIEN